MIVLKTKFMVMILAGLLYVSRTENYENIDEGNLLSASTHTSARNHSSHLMRVSHQNTLFSGLYTPNTKHSSESYAGSWLTGKQQFLDSIDRIRTITNLEGATFSLIRGRINLMTRDYFDFQVVHLSSTTNQIPSLDRPEVQKELAHRMKKTVEHLRVGNMSSSSTSSSSSSSSASASTGFRFRDKRILRHTLVVIPFSTNPASQGMTNNKKLIDWSNSLRYLFLQATVYSIHRSFPKIAVAFASKQDIESVKSLGLPIWKYIDLTNDVTEKYLLPKATLLYLHRKLSNSNSNGTIIQDNQEWSSIKYIYYTESDHILYSRFLPSLYNTLDKLNNTAVIVPHRMQTIALPSSFPEMENLWKGTYAKEKLDALRKVEVLIEDAVSPKGSCCDNGRFKFGDCGNWWYNCKDYGLQSYKQWIRFGEHGFTLPLGTEHQGRCSYNSTKILCPLPSNCLHKVPRNSKDTCIEIPNVEYIPPQKEPLPPPQQQSKVISNPKKPETVTTAASEDLPLSAPVVSMLPHNQFFSGLYSANTKYSAENYAGAWLVHKDRLFSSLKYIKEIISLEGASFSIIDTGFNLMTRDFFDFQVIHLSSTTNQLPDISNTELQKVLIEQMKKSVESLAMAKAASSDFSHRYRDFRMLRQTIVVIPFSTSAASQSFDEKNKKLTDFTTSLRFLYLQATFWSVYRIFPKIIVYFASSQDIESVKALGLPIWKYIDLSVNLTDKHLLPKAALLHIHDKLQQRGLTEFFDWLNMKYVYYTESDHILHSRFLPSLYNAFEKFNGSLAIIPHRMQTIALPKAFPGLEYIWNNDVWNKNKVAKLKSADLIVEDILIPQGSCCDDGRFRFGDCGNWWYNCKNYGLENYTQWVRFGEHGFTLPLGTEHQAKCKYSRSKVECKMPPGCSRKVPRDIDEACPEVPKVVFIGGGK